MRDPRARAGVVLGPVLLIVSAAAIVRLSGGHLGAFLNLEALAFVAAGTVLMVWAAFPVHRWKEADAAAYGAQCAVTMGWLGTLLGVILFLSAADLTMAPRRLALSLNALFFGMMLSKGVLMPRAMRLKRFAGASPRHAAA